MIQRLLDFALRQRLVVLAATLALIVIGVNSYLSVPIEAYPDVGDTQVQVITQWVGHAAEEVERQITLPIERAMNSAPHQNSVRSVSIAGLSVVTVTFAEGTGDYFARAQALERISQVDLPDGVDAGLGPLASPIAEIMRYQLISCRERRVAECSDEDMQIEPRSLSELKDLEEWVVERELLRADGVADVASFGGTVKQYQVLLSPTLLSERGLTLDDVEEALSEANGNGGGGVIALGPEALNVRAMGLLSPAQVADVAVATREGVPVRVRDVGTVQVGYRVRLGRVSVNEDKDVVAAVILLRRGDDATAVLERVHEHIRDLNTRILPRGVKLHPYQDRSQLMELTTHTVLENLSAGVGLVTLILFVFLGSPRAALIVAITIPLSLLSAFIGMHVMGIPANLLSIGAVDFGMIVDGSIVMVENIFRLVAEKHEHGEEVELVPLVRTAAREVARPIVFAIMIIVASYLPIFTLQRVEGRLFRPMAFTVGFALLGALIMAITLVPVISTYILKGNLKESRNVLLEWVRRGYLPLVTRLLKRPKRVFIVSASLLLADAVLYTSIGSEFLPHLNEGALWVRASMPGNISLQEAEKLVDGYQAEGKNIPGMREILRKFPEVGTMAVQLGRPDDGTDPTGFFNAEFLLVINDRKTWRPQFGGDREKLEDAMAAALSAIPGVGFGFSQPISDNVEEALTGVKGQLAVKVIGDDLNALDDLGSRIAGEIATVRGVRDLGIFREIGQSNMHLEIDRKRCERLGLTVQEVEHVIEVGMGGHVVTDIVEGERTHDLVVRFQEEARDHMDTIARIPVPTDAGHAVPLSEIATLRIQGGASRIYRENGRRYLALKFSVRGRDLGSTVDEARARVAKVLRVPPGYSVEWGGEFESAQRAGKRLSIVIPLTVVLIFVLLFAMFRRTHEAALILGNVLVTSPFGGLLALLLTGTNFSVSAGVGFLALFGVSVQTGVILVAYINELRAEGKPLDEAIEQATDLRLRPMMMTALVATLGLLPAALSHGIGSDSQKPIAIVVVGGLISSLALSLFTLPLLYKVFAPPAPQKKFETGE
ncbi:MAG TPA: CusA/CzcA family heavy metal efflux RND transporter, partial [Polyangiales bacterium]|nr:CusA/CzcA family heavy metal efflux RND transporter [Polyangiales bacterium]